MAHLTRKTLTLVTETQGRFRTDEYGRPGSLEFVKAYSDPKQRDGGDLIIRGTLPVHEKMYVSRASVKALLRWLRENFE